MPILDLNDKKKVEEYDRFIETSPYGNMMQARAWSDVKNNWNHDYVYTEDEDGKINSALSILSIKNDGEHAFMYAPRGPVCDPSDINQIKRLLKEADPVVEKRSGFLLRMDPEALYSKELIAMYEKEGYVVNASLDDASKGTYSNPPYNMILHLEGMDREALCDSYKSRDRSLIRKTYRDGLYTNRIDKQEESFYEALEELNELMQTVADREDISLRNLDYLKRIAHAFEDVKIFETCHPEGEVLSSSLVVSYNKKSFYIYAGSSNNHRKLNASTQMNQEAIEYALDKGYLEYDMGGIFSTDAGKDGLYRFKRRFVRKDDYTRYIGEIDVVYNRDYYKEFLKDN